MTLKENGYSNRCFLPTNERRGTDVSNARGAFWFEERCIISLLCQHPHRERTTHLGDNIKERNEPAECNG